MEWWNRMETFPACGKPFTLSPSSMYKIRGTYLPASSLKQFHHGMMKHNRNMPWLWQTSHFVSCPPCIRSEVLTYMLPLWNSYHAKFLWDHSIHSCVLNVRESMSFPYKFLVVAVRGIFDLHVKLCEYVVLCICLAVLSKNFSIAFFLRA